ncbi:hypothetical protein [uncultured Campylobacter sp.]|uniref:hypothetical protein n=1 Tax=uncultured Campylobacter sp. TaxID=218934 RepID=UPI00260F0C9C|nr:hypothetical protein [uncultured Campylobacter sp.]
MIVGSLLAGFGAHLAFGCSLLNYFTKPSYFSLRTWILLCLWCWRLHRDQASKFIRSHIDKPHRH